MGIDNPFFYINRCRVYINRRRVYTNWRIKLKQDWNLYNCICPNRTIDILIVGIQKCFLFIDIYTLALYLVATILRYQW
jgi:hypothetical protein